MKEAARFYRLAAEQGDALAQYNLGLMYGNGEGVLQNQNEAINWYRKAAAQGQKDARQYLDGLNIAQPAIQTGVAPTAQKAEQSLPEIRKAAEQGNAADQFKRGLAYERGEGVPQDKKEAARLYRLAAEQGYALAQLYLGWAYEYRDGVPRDMKEAARLYRLAADQGNADAQNALGRAYSNGEGVPQDKKEAERWYAKAAKQGNALAQSNLVNHQEQRKGREDAARGAPQWADADNGAYINWNDAKAYCASKGRGWRLPTVAELQGNYDTVQSTRCGNRICHVASKSRLTGSEFWSIELYDDSSSAWGVDLHDGRRISLNVGDRGGGALALCVRRH
jgi:TPR repeat protein